MAENPVLPVTNFSLPTGGSVPKGLGGLIHMQTAYSQQGTLPPTGGGAAMSFFDKMNADQAIPTTGLRTPLSAARKYDDPILRYSSGRDNEDLYAQDQSFFGSVGAGIGRLATTTLTKLGTGIGYVGAGLVNAFDGNGDGSFEQRMNNWMSHTADNAFSKWFEGLEEDIKVDLMPIYQDASDRNKGFFARAFSDTNFWTEDFTDGAAFMLSSMIPGMALSKLGFGAKVAGSLIKGIDSVSDAEKILKGLKVAGTTGFDEAVSIPHFAKVLGKAKLARSIDVGATTLLSTASESMFEANEVKKQVRSELTGKVNPDTGYAYTEQEIADRSALAARGTFNMNMVALAMSNLWEANLIFKRLPSASSIDNIKFSPGIFSKAEFSKPNYLAVFGKNAAKGIGVEGLYEENAQLAISRFNEAQYTPSSGKFSSSVVSQYFNQLGDAVMGDDPEAAMSIGMGGILGGIVGGVLSTRQDKQQDRLTQGRITNYNKVVDGFKALKNIWATEDVKAKDENGKEITVKKIKVNAKGHPMVNPAILNAFIEGQVQTAELNTMIGNADKSNLTTMKAMLENELFSQFALAHFELGAGDALREKFAALQQISDDDLAILGYDPSSKAQGIAKLQAAKTKVDKLETLYNDIQANVIPGSKNTELRKRKLFELGARQIFLLDQHTRVAHEGAMLEKSASFAGDYNQKLAALKASDQHLRGLEERIKQQDLAPDQETDADILVNAQKAYDLAKKEIDEFEDKYKEFLKDIKKDKDGFYKSEEATDMELRKRNGKLIEAAGLKAALVDTVNKFNRIGSRKGSDYFDKYVKEQEATFEPGEDFTAEDKTLLNSKLTALAGAQKYQPVVDFFPKLTDIKYPVNRKLADLKKAEGELGMELYNAFLDEVKQFRAGVLALRKVAKKKEEEAKKQASKEKENKEKEEKLKKHDATASTEATKSPAEDEAAEVNAIDASAKKPIEKLFVSTTYSEEQLKPHNLREQHLLLSVDNIPNRANLRVITVTKNNETALGLGGVIEKALAGFKDDNAILAVYVEVDKKTKYFVDQDGKRLGKVGENVNLDEAVYGFLPTASLTWANGDTRYSKATEETAKKFSAAWEKDRARILGYRNDEHETHEFKVSRGIPVKDNVAKPVSQVIDKKHIDENSELIVVSKLGVIRHNGEDINIPSGRPMLSLGSTLMWLDNDKLGAERAQLVFDLLKRLVATYNGTWDVATINFLQSLIHFKSPYGPDGKRKEIAKNQVFFEKGFFHFGSNAPFEGEQSHVPFSVEGLEQYKDKILSFLTETYTNVNDNTLKKKDAYTEIVSINADGTLNTRKWKSYQHYLLSDTYDLVDDHGDKGKSRKPLLTTKIVAAVDENRPFVYKYSYATTLMNEKPVAPAEKAATKSGTKKKTKEEPKSDVADGEEFTAEANGGALVIEYHTMGGLPVIDNVVLNGQPYSAPNEGAKQQLLDIIYQSNPRLVRPKQKEEKKEVKQETKQEPELLVATVNNGEAKIYYSVADDVVTVSKFEMMVKGEMTPQPISDKNRGALTALAQESFDKSQDKSLTENKEVATPQAGTPAITDEEIEEMRRKAKEEEDEDDGALRLVLSEDVVVGNAREEKAFIEKKLGIPVHVVENLIQATGGGWAWGQFRDNAVYLYQNAEEGTGYHEAFEAVWAMFNSPKEKQNMVREFRARQGSFVDRPTGRTISHEDATEDEVREQLAEEFRDYILAGKAPQKGFISRFFMWLLNLIKKILTPDAVDINEVFERIGAGYYRNNPVKNYKGGVHDRRVIPGLSNSDSYRVLRAVGNRVLREFTREESGRHITEFDEFADPTKEVFDSVRKTLEKYYNGTVMKKLIKQNASNDQIRAVMGKWTAINANWGLVTELAEEYLRTVNIVAAPEKDDTLAEEDKYDISKEEAYLVDVFTYDGKKNAPASIKLLIASITKAAFVASKKETLDSTEVYKEVEAVVDGSTMLEESVQYARTFNKLLQELYSLNTSEEKVAKLLELTDVEPDFVAFAKRLKLHIPEDQLSEADWKLRVRFAHTFAMQRPTPLIQYIKEGGDTYMGSASLEDARNREINTWFATMKARVGEKGSLLHYNKKDKRYFLDSSYLKGLEVRTLEQKFTFLDKLGIKVDDDIYLRMSDKHQERFEKAVTTLAHFLQKGGIIPATSHKSMQVAGPFNTIAEAIISVQANYEPTHFNISGKRVQEFIKPNAISVIVNDINNSNSLEELVTRLPHLNTPFSRASLFLSTLFSEGKKTRRDLETKYISGTRDERTDNENQPTDKLTLPQRALQEFNQNVNGDYYVLVPADSQTEHMVDMGNSLSYDTIATDGGGRFYAIMNRYYQIERDLYAADGKIRTLGAAFDPEYKSENITEPLQAFLLQTMNEEFKLFQQYGIVVDRNGQDKWFRFENLDSKFALENNIDVDQVSKEQLAQIISFRNMNYMINNIEMMKIFFGDPAAYPATDNKDYVRRFKSFLSPREASFYGSLIFNTHLDNTYNVAGGVKLQPTDPGYHVHKEYMKTVSLADVYTSNENQESDKYEENNSTDAESYAALPAYREMLIKSGYRWTSKHEDQYQYRMAMDRLAMDEDGVYPGNYRAELKAHDEALRKKGDPRAATFPVLKPIVSGFENNTQGPLLDKYSIAPLSYSIVRNRNLSQMYLRMQKEGVSYVIFESGRKVGTTGKDTVYNADGTVNTAPFLDTAKVDVPFKFFGIQVETAGSKDSTPQGSQLTKLSVVNLLSGGVPKDIDMSFDEWNKLSEAERQGKSPIYKAVRENIMLLRAMNKHGYDTLLHNLGIEDDGESFTVVDKERILRLVKKELYRREISNNIKEQLKLDPQTNDFVVPLEALNNYQQVKSILYSYVDKYIGSPKMNGGPRIQISGTGWEVAGKRIVKKNVNGKDVLVSAGLRFYEKGEKKTRAIQVLLPNWFAADLRRSGIKKSNDEMIAYLNESEDGRKILTGIGFRIPTQEVNSVEVFEVAGFLPPEMGDSIVLPEEITTKAGSDFDVDKLNTYLKNVYLDRGEIKLVKLVAGEDVTAATKEFFGKVFDKKYEGIKNFKAKVFEALQLMNPYWSMEDPSGLIDKYRDALNTIIEKEEEIHGEIKTLHDWADMEDRFMKSMENFESLRISYVNKMYRQALENAYFDNLEELLMHPDNFDRLTAPNTSDEIKAIRKELVDLAPEEFGGHQIRNIINPVYMRQERHNNLLGKGAVGIAAIQQTYNALSQLGMVYIDPERLSLLNENDKIFLKNGVHINLPHNMVSVNGKLVATISLRTDRNGRFISDKISQYINGYVDIAKDQFIVQIGASEQLASIFMLLERLGVPTETTVFFMNQPIIREYMKNLAREGMRWKYDGRMIEEIQKDPRFKADKAASSFDTQNVNDLDASLKNNIEKFYAGTELTDREKATQQFVLNEFLKYSVLADNMLGFSQGSNYDTANFSDPNLMYKKEYQTQQAREHNIFNSVDVVLNNSFIGDRAEKMLTMRDALSETLFKIENAKVRAFFQPIIEELFMRRMKETDYLRAARKIEQSFISYILQVGIGLNTKLQSHLVDVNTAVAKELTQVKNLAGPIANNLIVQNLQPRYQEEDDKVKTIVLASKPTDVITEDAYVGAMEELRDHPATRDFYYRLIEAAFLSTGIGKSFSSITDIIPGQDFADMVNKILGKLDDLDLLKGFIETDSFFRNNYGDPHIVPRIKDYSSTSQLTGEKTFPNRFSSDKVKALMVAKGIKHPNFRLFKINATNQAANARYASVKVVKPGYTDDQVKKMKRENDYSFQETVLLRRLDREDGTPATYIEKKSNKVKVIFYPTPAWGHSYRAQEHWSVIRSSVLNNDTLKPEAWLSAEEIREGKITSFSIPNAPSGITLEGDVVLTKVISGLQTGVDTLGLEVAKELGYETGGTAAPGFLTEGGKSAADIAGQYGVTAISNDKQWAKTGKQFYLPRTELNVMDSDGTVYYSTDVRSAGRVATEGFATKHKKPFIYNPTAKELRNFLIKHQIKTLNIAGNRGSKLNMIQAQNIKNLIKQALRKHVTPPANTLLDEKLNNANNNGEIQTEC